MALPRLEDRPITSVTNSAHVSAQTSRVTFGYNPGMNLAVVGNDIDGKQPNYSVAVINAGVKKKKETALYWRDQHFSAITLNLKV